ncbi:glycine--tRNA ligase [Petrimonas mucosa]|jgi:glycyl-tRNA synthetase|uniref:Glycine--tRNA ligase n=2 Tax=Petrimonas TaxID=307628 RepID=A0A1G4G680_9BACT|nr:glycine--tRNA ligase [Petrimonas mucosa]MDD3561719.1 glycine--tRNA ligase [Petrimonas mucosa]SCM57176.1 Glycine-tRNA ligase {ECO:0000255/HAMAP-Rule:MF_00253} [Petrimonas mucosa]SFU32231.1 glycyl-tRNA synthetase [Porphyromonadaceae bacterium KHP3R9]HHT29234.1 glycine--tRNA ligase [Petrimonas mucosa]
MAQEDVFKKIVSHCKEYGFVFPSSEIYDGLGAVYDYGQLGVELKNNIKKYWWDSMTLLHENVVGIDSAIFMHPTIWKASGHVDAFNDPLIDNKDSKKRYRADVLIEEYLARIDEKIDKEVEKAARRFGESFDETMFRQTNPRVLENQKRRDEVHARFAKALNDGNLEELRQIIVDCEIACPISGTRNWTEVRQFNLMFATEMGSTADGAMKVYLRPETAQGIFVNFLNVQKTGRMKIPFGIAQIGKAFRNEIVARQFIFRMREFEQMEMQFFVAPGTELQWFEYWKQERLKWHKALGFGDENYQYHDHDKLAHYANAATDIEFRMPFGFKEVEGIHSRTDFDLSQHEKYSGKKMQYFDPELNTSYVPYVVETSIGVDRMFLSVISSAYCEEQLEGGETRVVLKIPAALAPVKLAVLPLVKKDGLPEKATEIMNALKFSFACQYDEKDSIGRRYRRQDAIGTPYCVTIDHQTLADNTVTVRDRDTMEQKRVTIDEIEKEISLKTDIKQLLKKLA